MPHRSAEPPALRPWHGLGVICTAMFISAMDMTIVNVALPDMSRDLDAGIGELQWVMDGFLVALAGLLLVGSGLADRFGRRRVFLSGFAGFALASLLAAVATTPEAVIGARVLMGIAAACVLPPALSLLAVIFPPELRPKAVGIWSAVAGLGLALGPVVGGVLVDVAGWQWVFLVNVPVAVVAVPAGLAFLPESRRPGAPPLDIVGAALSTLALGGVVFALIEGVDAGWTSPEVLGTAVGGLLLGFAFVRLELRLSHPLFDVRVLRRRRVACGGLAILSTYVAALGMLFLLPQYLQYVQGRSPLVAGALMCTFGVGMGVTAPIGGRLASRGDLRTVLAGGLAIAATGFLPLLVLGSDVSPLLVTLGVGIVGGGLGLAFPPGTAVIMNDLGIEKAGEGAAVNQLSRQVGGALGVAVIGSIFAAVYRAHVEDALRSAATATRDLAQSSIEGASRAAAGLPAEASTRLLARADDGFDLAARVGLGVCMAVLLGAALLAWIGLAEPRTAAEPAAVPAASEAG